MCGKNLWHISTVEYHVYYESLKIVLLRLALYRAGPNALRFEWTEAGSRLTMSIIKPAEAGLVWSMVIDEKKDAILRFRIDYRKLNAVAICNLYPVRQTDERK